jgi:D-proline reductase (dithiol) PrdB
MGGGGNIEKFTNETGPQVAEMLKSEGVDACLLTAG